MGDEELQDRPAASAKVPEGTLAGVTLGRARTMAASPVMPSHLPAARIGSEADHDYRVRGELGRGGMASVLLAEQRSLRREVALKRLLDNGEEAEDLLLHEAVITGQLEHPNIVPVHAIVKDEEGPAVVLKRVSGTAWDALFEQSRVPLDRHLEIWLQVCNAIAFAHSRGVMHLDIKPSNVMIGDFGEVYVMDWGIARRVGDEAEPTVLGTPCYMAPEMTQGQFSPQSDVFLLGATLYEALMGKAPFDAIDAIRAVGRAARCEPFAYDATVPEELRRIVDRACAPAPSDRFEDVTALRRAVSVYREHRAARALIERAADSQARMLARMQQDVVDARHYAEIQSRFSEARLAYEQALASWPGSPDAQQGLRTCLLAMIEHELSLDHADTALSLVQSLQEPPAELVERVYNAASSATDARTRLRALQRDVDPSVGARGRGRAFAAFLAAVVIMTGALTVSRTSRPGFAPTTERLASVGTIVLGLFLAAAVAWRASSQWNQVNRRIATLAGGALAISCLHRWSAVRLGLAPEHVLIGDAFILSLGGIGLSVFHRAGVWLAALGLSLAGLGVLYPAWVDDLFIALSVTVPLVVLLLVLRARRQRG